jgi:hypothetical protein
MLRCSICAKPADYATSYQQNNRLVCPDCASHIIWDASREEEQKKKVAELNATRTAFIQGEKTHLTPNRAS